MRDAIVIALAVIGLAFTLSGAVGILRMPDVYSRIQCSSKTVTMGALPVLIALVVGQGPISSYGSRALLVAVLLLIVNPAASHALVRAAYKAGVPMWPGAVTDEPRAAAGHRAADDRAADDRAADDRAADDRAADDRAGGGRAGGGRTGGDPPGSEERPGGGETAP
ncbi:MAG TPA: monovalent cation/H(+) antiporter subunit G [Streptosporangiaceae bacterium]